MQLSPRLCFSLRYSSTYEPWFGELNSYGTDAVLSVVCSLGWTELYARRKASKQWTLLGAFPTSFWRSLDSSVSEDLKMSYLEKFASASPQVSKEVAPNDKNFAKDYPALSEFCWATTWPDGQTRQPSSLTFFAEEGMWKVCLSERDRGVSLWGTGPTFEIALQCLEDRLTSDRPDWRKSKRSRGK